MAKKPAQTDAVLLSPLEFKREMLRGALLDLATARQAQSFTAVTALTKHCNVLRDEIAEEERRATAAAPPPARSEQSDEQLVEIMAAAVAKLPEAAFERLCAAVDLRRVGRPSLRVVES